jgi:mRNA (guanine-N7-)-methyltransferase
VDICLPLLKNAIERIKKMNKMKMKCIFICKNVNEQYIFENESLKDYWFDIVSCQFSMHYHFSSEDNLRVFLKNVSSRLQEGGYFIGTIIDSEILRSKIKKHKSLCFGNEFYQIKFGENEFDKKGFYGKKYGFYLEGLIGDKIISNDQKSLIFVEEYLIDFENFCKVAKEYDLHLREKQSFNDFYLHNMKSNHYSELYEKTVKSKKNKNNKQKWEVIDLYQVFRFQKGSPNRNYISYYDSLKNELILDFNPELIVDKVI